MSSLSSYLSFCSMRTAYRKRSSTHKSSDLKPGNITKQHVTVTHPDSRLTVSCVSFKDRLINAFISRKGYPFVRKRHQYLYSHLITTLGHACESCPTVFLFDIMRPACYSLRLVSPTTVRCSHLTLSCLYDIPTIFAFFCWLISGPFWMH